MKAPGKAFDFKGAAAAFGEAFDPKGCVAAFREAFDLGDAARSFAAGFRDGGNLLGRHLRWASAMRHVGRQHAEAIEGRLRLQRLLADVAGGGGSAVRALGEIRGLLRPFNPEIDKLPDDHIPGIVQRLIDDLQKPAARPEDFSGAVRAALADAQAKAAALDFADAAHVLDEALAQTAAEDHERARGRAALLAERGRIARLQLRYRDAAAFYRQAADAVAFDASAAWAYAVHSALALCAQGEEFGDNAALENAIKAYKSALHLVPREQAPLDWAGTQNNLGNALGMLGERESGTGRLEEAIAAFRSALHEYTRQRVPLQWATAQNNLGISLARLGERESGPARLEQAVAAFHAALQECTRERAPLDWAMTQNNLGNALGTLGEREGSPARLEKAVSAFRAALQEWTRERVPLQWATGQNNLGIALAGLGERDNDTARLEEAVIAFNAALQERTHERVPLDRALTQYSLGNALRALGQRERGAARRDRLEAAIAACDAALEVFVESGADYYVELAQVSREAAICLLEAKE